jgi:hypothetical protein
MRKDADRRRKEEGRGLRLIGGKRKKRRREVLIKRLLGGSRT